MVNGKREKKNPQLFHKYATINAQFQDLKTYCKPAQSETLCLTASFKKKNK